MIAGPEVCHGPGKVFRIPRQLCPRQLLRHDPPHGSVDNSPAKREDERLMDAPAPDNETRQSKQAPDPTSEPKSDFAPRKLICLETYWGDHNARLFQDTSVLPFLSALSSRLDPPLRVAHRFVDSLAQLAHYTANPDGLLWRDPETFDAPVFYLSFHGSSGTLRSALVNLDAQVVCEAFRKWGGTYDNLVYFAACSVFAGDSGRQFVRDFLRESGCRAVLGYATDIDWTESMLTDMLFLFRFYRDADPWGNLQAIHESVIADFAPARRLGFELHMR